MANAGLTRPSRRWWTRRGRARGESGAGTAELVVATPALLFLIMLVVQFALWFHAAHVVTAAAQEGARAARVEGGSAGAGEGKANSFLDDLAGGLLTGRSTSASRGADTACVTVTGDVQKVVPKIPMPKVEATSCGPVERFRDPRDAP